MRIVAVRALSRSARAATSVSRKWTYAFSIVILISLCHVAAGSVSSHAGQIAGTVVDPAGATIDGADVVLVGAGTEAHRSIKDQHGRFTIESLGDWRFLQRWCGCSRDRS